MAMWATSDAWSFLNRLFRAEEQFFQPPTLETSSDRKNPLHLEQSAPQL
jgi:hypothetical protein